MNESLHRVKMLSESGFTQKQAKASVEMMNDYKSDFKHEFQRLENKMESGFIAIDKRFNQMDAKFNEIDTRFNEIDTRFNQIDERFNGLDKKFATKDDLKNLEISLSNKLTIRLGAMIISFLGVLSLLKLFPF